MSNWKKALIWLVVIAGILYLYFGNLNKGTKTIICIWAGVSFILWLIHHEIRALELDKMCQSIDRRFRCIEHRIGLVDDTDEKMIIAKPVAYKMHLGLLPHWEKILEKLAEQNEQKPDDFIEEILNDKELGIEKGEGLSWKDFWFDIYQDEFSGMQQVWSHQYKTLVDGWVIKGRLFEPWPMLSRAVPKKYTYNYVRQPLTLTPYSAWFEQFYSENDVIKGRTATPYTDTPYNDVFKDGKIAEIPYFDIIKLLLELGKILTPHCYAIRKFPKELQQNLEKSNIRYDNEPYSFQNYGTEFDFSKDEDSDTNEIGWNNEQWFKDKGIKLYEKTVDSHVFHTPYYSVSISLEIFEPPRQPVFQA